MTKTDPKLRTMPIVEGAPTPYFEPGLPIEVHVQIQHVPSSIDEAYPVYPMVALDDGTGDCTC